MSKDKAGEKRTAAQQGARAMAHARWAGVSKKERSRLMSAAGKKGGGRPKSAQRCFCGAHTMERARSRAFDCCRHAGLLTMEVAQTLRSYHP